MSLASKLDHLLVERDTRNPAFKREIKFYARFAVIRGNDYREHIVVTFAFASNFTFGINRFEYFERCSAFGNDCERLFPLVDYKTVCKVFFVAEEMRFAVNREVEIFVRFKGSLGVTT